MKRKIHTYEGDGFIVEYDVARCIHAAECVQGLPAVFDPSRRPWIDASRAPADAVAETVRRCPTGALHQRRENGVTELPPSGNTVRVVPGGPLYLRGRLRLRWSDGETLEETRLALCRCGASSNKPFCDNSHVAAAFGDAGENVEARLRPAEDEAGDGVLEVRLALNGPLVLAGPVTVIGADGSAAEGAKGSLCRCGHSAAKPFCDGAHKAAVFAAD